MNIAKLRNQPFILLVLKDGEDEGYFSPDFMLKTKQQLSDMSLRIASDNLSIIYADQIKKGCEIVLGIINLGLLTLCDNDTEKAKAILKKEGIVYCFRAGWAKYANLKKVSPSYFEEISLTSYALGANDTRDIRVTHEKFVSDGYQSAMLLQSYKSIASSYCASTPYLDSDEDVLKFELQKFLNTAIALLLIDSDKKAFTTSLYTQLTSYFNDTDKNEVLEKVDVCIDVFSTQIPKHIKDYLQEIELFLFSDLKSIIKQHDNIADYIPEMLELPVNIVNELHDDFEGGYDFHADDDEDLAYLLQDDF